MRLFSSETAIATIELEQMILDWARGIDENYGRTASGYFTPDCIYRAGRVSLDGREAMDEFYEGRRAAVKAEHADGLRTARHMVSNFRAIVHDDGNATITFLITNFSQFGAPPLMHATTPTVVSDVLCECKRNDARQWEMAELHGAPIFVGGDAFLTKSLVG